jgi:hypothetical protein
MRAGAAAGPGRSSPDAHREVCEGLTPINLASCARENTFARYRTRCSDKGSSAATRPVRAAPRTAAFLVGAFFAGALTATFFDALLATPVLFVAISPPYPIFFVGNNVTSTTGPRCLSPADHPVLGYLSARFAGLTGFARLTGLTAVATCPTGTTRAASASPSTGTAVAPRSAGPAISRIVWAGSGGGVDRDRVANRRAVDWSRDAGRRGGDRYHGCREERTGGRGQTS